jgi:hypothetical protein
VVSISRSGPGTNVNLIRVKCIWPASTRLRPHVRDGSIGHEKCNQVSEVAPLCGTSIRTSDAVFLFLFMKSNSGRVGFPLQPSAWPDVTSRLPDCLATPVASEDL